MSGPKSNPIAFVRLHRLHAAPVATRVQLEALGQTWRGEGGLSASKAAVAYRLALCWNVCEGIPSSKLEAGFIGDLCDAVMAGEMERAQAIVKANVDDVIDATNGRLHDCKQCLGEDGEVAA